MFAAVIIQAKTIKKHFNPHCFIEVEIETYIDNNNRLLKENNLFSKVTKNCLLLNVFDKPLVTRQIQTYFMEIHRFPVKRALIS